MFSSLIEKQLGLVLYHYVHNYQKIYWSCSENKKTKAFFTKKNEFVLSIFVEYRSEYRTIPDPESNFLSALQVQ